jgi:hypothetical protein
MENKNISPLPLSRSLSISLTLAPSVLLITSKDEVARRREREREKMDGRDAAWTWHQSVHLSHGVKTRVFNSVVPHHGVKTRVFNSVCSPPGRRIVHRTSPPTSRSRAMPWFLLYCRVAGRPARPVHRRYTKTCNDLYGGRPAGPAHTPQIH